MKQYPEVLMPEKTKVYRGTMTERPSYKWENTQYLLETFMKQLNITKDDLEKEPSWIKAKVRELNIDKIISE